ncbi:MAG: hypothetical protein ISP01_01870 [Methanobrevibacter arboriphilus]|uniref:Uncharacterized protein n=1 Tax=Methanobrevibacter arboriphilus TaxID=39441 RepID=A0A843AED5_METAZ|nr:hypothetical protein [Methanobrevibacter arboriphilus]MBF4468131.1 hypothetical protein [Methanobrevibacter arboriphilus]
MSKILLGFRNSATYSQKNEQTMIMRIIITSEFILLSKNEHVKMLM